MLLNQEALLKENILENIRFKASFLDKIPPRIILWVYNTIPLGVV